MFQLLLFLTLPTIFIMFVATVLLHLYLGWAIRRDVKDVLTELFEDAYQEDRQELARSIATPGGKHSIKHKTCLDCNVLVHDGYDDGHIRNEDGSFHICS